MTVDIREERQPAVIETACFGLCVMCRIIPLFAGTVLLLAAVLKWRELPVIEWLGDDLFHRAWFVFGQILFESTLALWLISGLWLQWSEVVGAFCFGVFAFVALYKAVTGAQSCGCFGQLEVNPWATSAVDLLTCAALVWSVMDLRTNASPRGVDSKISKKRRAAFMAITTACFASMALWRMPTGLPTEGIFFANGNWAILETEKWTGKRLPILSFLRTGQDGYVNAIHPSSFSSGQMFIVIYSDSCDHCRAIVPKLLDSMRRSGNLERCWFVEMPPYAPVQEDLVSSYRGASHLRLSNERQWFVETPTVIELEDGIVKSVIKREGVEKSKILPVDFAGAK